MRSPFQMPEETQSFLVWVFSTHLISSEMLWFVFMPYLNAASLNLFERNNKTLYMLFVCFLSCFIVMEGKKSKTEVKGPASEPLLLKCQHYIQLFGLELLGNRYLPIDLGIYSMWAGR